jgi:hypothetical protein
VSAEVSGAAASEELADFLLFLDFLPESAAADVSEDAASEAVPDFFLLFFDFLPASAGADVSEAAASEALADFLLFFGFVLDLDALSLAAD